MSDLDDNYKNALIIDAVVLGAIIVGGVVLNFLCKKFYRPGSFLCIQNNERSDENQMMEHQGSNEVNLSEVIETSGTNNNGYQSTEGAVGTDRGDIAIGVNDEPKTQPPAEMATIEQGDTKTVVDDQVIVAVDVTREG